MVAAPGGPDGCKGTDSPMGQGNNTWRAGLPVSGWAVPVMRHAPGSSKHALGVSSAHSHASNAPCIECFVLCGVPWLCRHQYLRPYPTPQCLCPHLVNSCLGPHQCLNASPYTSCTHASALEI